MAEKKPLDGIAVFASSYIKRFMETHYDTLMRSAPARTLLERNAATRYGIEASLYALLAYADSHWSPRTPLHRMVKGVVMDAPSEISKRLVNGFREEVLSHTPEDLPAPAQSVEQVLLNLDDETLGAMLAWLARTSTKDRARIRSLIATLSDEELQKLVSLTPDALDALINRAPSVEKPPSLLAQTIQDQLKQAHRRADEQLAARRNRSRS